MFLFNSSYIANIHDLFSLWGSIQYSYTFFSNDTLHTLKHQLNFELGTCVATASKVWVRFIVSISTLHLKTQFLFWWSQLCIVCVYFSIAFSPFSAVHLWKTFKRRWILLLIGTNKINAIFKPPIWHTYNERKKSTYYNLNRILVPEAHIETMDSFRLLQALLQIFLKRRNSFFC